MKKCFVIMPFSSTSKKHTKEYWNKFYEIIKAFTMELGYDCIRSESGPYQLIHQTIDRINTCDLAIAVLTDLNPNVWYELGIRHSLKNGTIMLLQNDQEIPFAMGAYGVITYDDSIPSSILLKKEIAEYIKKLQNFDYDSPVLDTLRYLSPHKSSKEKLDEIYELTMGLE